MKSVKRIEKLPPDLQTKIRQYSRLADKPFVNGANNQNNQPKTNNFIDNNQNQAKRLNTESLGNSVDLDLDFNSGQIYLEQCNLNIFYTNFTINLIIGMKRGNTAETPRPEDDTLDYDLEKLNMASSIYPKTAKVKSKDQKKASWMDLINIYRLFEETQQEEEEDSSEESADQHEHDEAFNQDYLVEDKQK
jgi:hypothetical protein